MSSSCAQWRGDIGAYVVGALDTPARHLVTRHLADCAGCRADYDELVPVRNWLSLLDLTTSAPEPGAAGQQGPFADHPVQDGAVSAADALAQPSWPESGTQIPVQPAGRPRGSRRRARRWAQAGGAILAAAAVAIAALVGSGTTAGTYSATDSATGVSAHAQLHDTPTGTQIDLTTTGLPRDQRCILVAIANSGTDIAGSWDATYAGSARIIATTAFPAGQLTALRIESDTGTLLVSIRL